MGAGVGEPRDNFANQSFQAITRLVWNGAAGATMIDIEPSGPESLYSNDVIGITADGASLAGIGYRIAQVSDSTFVIGGAETRSINILFTTQNISDAPGTQHNEIWATSRSTSSVYAPTGILFDSAPGANWNVSYNRMRQLSAWYANGDGIVFGNSDNNIIDDLSTYRNPNGTGTPAVFASSSYVPPNGVAVNGNAYTYMVRHTGTPVDVQGWQTGSTLVKNSGNACNGGGSSACGPATTTLVTTATTNALGNSLTFSSTSGIAVGEVVTCGGSSLGGMMPRTASYYLTANTVFFNTPAISTIPSGTSCVFSYGVTKNAAAGVYTITAASATTFNITAPAGGHSQTGVPATSGVINFTVVVLPFSGTPTAGDLWTLTLPAPATEINVQGIDNANASPNPNFDYGASGAYARTNTIYPVPIGSQGAGQLGLSIGNGSATGTGAVALGGGAVTASGASAVAWNFGTTAPGFGATAFGHNSLANGPYSVTMGENGVANGSMGRVGGEQGSDRGHYGADVWGCPQFAAQGDCQTRRLVLRGTGAGIAAIRLTADGASAGASNCVNTVANSGYSLIVTILAFDHTTPTKNATWQNWNMLLTEGVSVASEALVSASAPTPLSNGTLTGASVSAAADTTNGCLNLSFTPPTGNTDTWDIVGSIQSVEAQ